MPDDDEPPPKLSHEERAKLFDLPERPPPPAPVRPPVPDAPLELDRPAVAAPQVIERIRVGGIATIVRVFVISAVLAFVLFEALGLVYRH